FVGKPDYENIGLGIAADTEAYFGHLGRARELTSQAVDSATRADQNEAAAEFLAVASLRESAYGNAAEARITAQKALKKATTNQGAVVEAVLALAMAGDAARAKSLAQELGERFPLDTQIQSLWLPAIHAQLALYEKNPASALNSLKVAL